MNEYKYETIDAMNDYELQEKYVIEQNGQRIVVGYRIKHGEEISKQYFARGNARKAFFNAYVFHKLKTA